MSEVEFPRNRRDVAYIPKQKEFDIPATANEIINSLNNEDDFEQSVTSYVKVVLSNIIKTKEIFG